MQFFLEKNSTTKQNSYSTLAEAHLFQGRLVLLQLNFDEAQQFLTTAQKIAEQAEKTCLNDIYS